MTTEQREAPRAHRDDMRAMIVECAALGALMAVAFGLRSYGLSEWLPSADDLLHVGFGFKGSLREVIDASLQRDTHPPLLHVLIYLLHACGLFSLGTMRLLGIVPGVLVVPLFYGIGRQATGTRTAGYFMASLATFGASVVLVSEMVRQYTLLLFFLSLATWSALRLVAKPRRRDLWMYFCAALLAVTTHYGSAFLLAGVGVAGLLHASRHPQRLRALAVWSGGHLFLAAVFALQMKSLLGRASVKGPGYLAWVKGVTLTSVFDAPRRLLDLQHGLLFASDAATVPFVFGALVLGGVGAALRFRRYDLVIVGLLPVVLNIAAARLGVYQLANVRQTTYLLLPAGLLAACTFRWVFERFGPRGGAAFVLIVGSALLTNAIRSTGSVFRPDALRQSSGPARNEMPYRRADARGAYAWLASAAGPYDTIGIDWTLQALINTSRLADGQGWDELPQPRLQVSKCEGYLFRLDSVAAIARCRRAVLQREADLQPEYKTARLWILVATSGVPPKSQEWTLGCVRNDVREDFGDVALLGFDLQRAPRPPHNPRCP